MSASPPPVSSAPRPPSVPSAARRRAAIWYSLRAIQLVPAALLLLLTAGSLRFSEWRSVVLLVACGGSIAAFAALEISERWLRKLGPVACILGGLVVASLVSAAASQLVFKLLRNSRFIVAFRPDPHPTYAEIDWDPECLLIGSVLGFIQVGLWTAVSLFPSALEAERVRTLELGNVQLEANELRMRAEVERLRSQLEPHFLLNTLNLISGLVTADPERARTVIVTLGDLLQDALVEHEDLHTVERELAWLRRYVEILEARHGDMLRVHWRVAPMVESALLPRLLLQPLLENAIRHGALRSKAGGSVAIHVTRSHDALHCTIVDDGPGLGANRPGAVGLDNVRRRLAVHFPTGALTIASDEAGTRATVTLPFTEPTPNAPSHQDTRR